MSKINIIETRERIWHLWSKRRYYKRAWGSGKTIRRIRNRKTHSAYRLRGQQNERRKRISASIS